PRPQCPLANGLHAYVPVTTPTTSSSCHLILWKFTVSGPRNVSNERPEFGRFTVWVTPLPATGSWVTEVGASTSNEIVPGPPVTVILCCVAGKVSGAVKVTVRPLAAESGAGPTEVDQATLPITCVSLTSSPTPIVVRVRAPGDVSTVSL